MAALRLPPADPLWWQITSRPCSGLLSVAHFHLPLPWPSHRSPAEICTWFTGKLPKQNVIMDLNLCNQGISLFMQIWAIVVFTSPSILTLAWLPLSKPFACFLIVSSKLDAHGGTDVKTKLGVIVVNTRRSTSPLEISKPAGELQTDKTGGIVNFESV